MRIGIVGAGIVGLATAWQLARLAKSIQIVLLEKEVEIGRHQSTHNSGVLHSGLYYRTNSLKARLSVRGIRLMTEFCREHGISHEICGKLVLATNEREVAALRALMEQGQRNGLQGLRWLSPEEIAEREPHAGGIAGLYVPEEGIVDYKAVCLALKANIVKSGTVIRTEFELKHLSKRENHWEVESRNDRERFDFLINCGGLQSDRIASMAGHSTNVRIMPFRGEYYQLKKESRHLIRHLIYPVPNGTFPFLGVHFTRMIHGGVEAGPNAVLALAREGYARRAFDLRDARDSIFFPGLWKFLARYPRTCGRELAMSFFKDFFCQELRRLVPEITSEDLEPGGVGIRAQAMSRDGSLIQDFHLISSSSDLHVINAPSPAATASLAIGDIIAQKVLSSIKAI